jgi:hypothetical protein
MKRLILIALVACGGGKATSPAKPVENVAPPSSSEASSGDGEAREIQRTQDGGVIELDGYRDTAMRAAEAAMARHCGSKGYVITQEGEEAIVSPADAGGDATTTRTATAWRVHYACATR